MGLKDKKHIQSLVLVMIFVFLLAASPARAVASTNQNSFASNLNSALAAPEIPVSTTSRISGCEKLSPVCKSYFQFGFIGETIAKANQELPQLSTAISRKPSLTLWFQDFSEKLNIDQVKTASANGQLPIITWEPQKLNDKIPDNYPLKDISSGKFDKYLTACAKLAKRAKVPFIIRFAHEMNGYWYPWGQPKTGDPRSLATRTNTPETYVNAYRHVHDVFNNVGATNVLWMWSPNLIDATPTISLKALYPGDSYVDVIGLSGYLRDAGQTFSTRYPKTLQILSEISATKPIIVAESGIDTKLNRTLLIKDLLFSLAHTAQVQGLLWLNKTTTNYDFNISNDSAGLATLKETLSQARFNPLAGMRFSYPGTPEILGDLTLGSTLAAKGTYSGHPSEIIYNWYSCASATDAESDCKFVGRGKYHYLEDSDRHRYIRLVMTTKSPLGIDSAKSLMAGPIMYVPESPIVNAVNLRGTSTQLTFGSVATTATNLQVQVDDRTPVYLPAASTEYWITGLTVGESHTYNVSYVDIFGQSKSVSTPVTGSFTAAKSPENPKLTINPTKITVQFPTPTTGQSFWKYWIDTQDPVTIASTETSIELTVPGIGQHTFNLVNISGTGSTLAKVTNFQILPAPIVTAVNLRGTSTQLTFGSAPSGVSKIVIRTADGATTYLAASTSEYWFTKLTLGQTSSYSITYQGVSGGNYFEGLATSGQFVALSSPVHATVAVAGSQITILFPTVASGQTGWRYWLDSGPSTDVVASKTSVILNNISAGTHRVWLQAIGQDGVTLSVPQPFDIAY